MVYRATLEEGDFHTEVAVKLMRNDDLPPSMLARFRDEARVLGLIRDRAVVRVFPPALLDGQPALIMEFVDGQSTAQLLKQNQGPLPPRVVTSIVCEVARALDAVYDQPGPDGKPMRLIHRDIKPANLQVTPTGNVKVLDFGIAKAAFEGRESETTAHIFGTMQYMAPERMTGENTASSDIYSLGCVFRRLMMGEKPLGAGQFKASPIVVERTEELAPVMDLIDAMVSLEPDTRPTAREVETACMEFVARLEGPRLRDWAEINVKNAQPDDCPRTGQFLRDTVSDIAANTNANGTGTVALTEAHSTSTIALDRRLLLGSLGVAGAAFALVLFSVATLAFIFYGLASPEPPAETLAASPAADRAPAPSHEPPPRPAPVQPVVAEALEAPEPAPVPAEPSEVLAVAPAPSAATPPPKAPSPVPSPTVEPAVETPLAEPATEPPTEATTTPTAPRIDIQDGGATLLFVNDLGRAVSANQLSAGTWVLRAAFDPGRPMDTVDVGSFKLSEGGTLNIRCVSAVRRCRVRSQ